MNELSSVINQPKHTLLELGLTNISNGNIIIQHQQVIKTMPKPPPQFETRTIAKPQRHDDDDDKDRHIERRAWGPDEDDAIRQLVARLGTKSWATIATALSREYNFHGKSAKQCRERWYNHLNPSLSKAPLSEEEERILLEAHRELGNKWAEIAKRLPGRSDNHVKNFWYSYMRREQKNGNFVNPAQLTTFTVRNPATLPPPTLPQHQQHHHQLLQHHHHQLLQHHHHQQQQPFILLKHENLKVAEDSDSEDERDVNMNKRQKV